MAMFEIEKARIEMREKEKMEAHYKWWAKHESLQYWLFWILRYPVGMFGGDRVCSKDSF